MSVKNDAWIIHACKKRGMITPCSYVQQTIGKDGGNCISFGVSSYGYDIRCADEFKVSTAPSEENEFKTEQIIDLGDRRRGIILKPGYLALAKSVERFKIPREVLGICVGKSSYARRGLIANITPLEPEWEGWLTLELSNISSRPVAIYADEGIAQLVFHSCDKPCLVSYKDRAGKYQSQPNEVVYSKL